MAWELPLSCTGGSGAEALLQAIFAWDALCLCACRSHQCQHPAALHPAPFTPPLAAWQGTGCRPAQQLLLYSSQQLPCTRDLRGRDGAAGGAGGCSRPWGESKAERLQLGDTVRAFATRTLQGPKAWGWLKKEIETAESWKLFPTPWQVPNVRWLLQGPLALLHQQKE